jgi:hypothetical protein
MIPGIDYIRILPEIVLSVFGMIVMVVDPLLPEYDSRKSMGFVSVLGCVCALCATFYQAAFPGTAFFNMVRVDGFSVFFHIVVIMVALITTLSSFEYLEVQKIRLGEYYGLIVLRPDLARHGRHVPDVLSHRVSAHLHCPRDLFHCDVRACGLSPPRRQQRGVVP